MKSLELLKTFQDSNNPNITKQLIDKIDIKLLFSRITFLLKQLPQLTKKVRNIYNKLHQVTRKSTTIANLIALKTIISDAVYK